MIPCVDTLATGKQIKQLMEYAELSADELKGIMGFTTPQSIYKWWRGQSLPTIDNLVILAHVLHVSIEDILVVYYV